MPRNLIYISIVLIAFLLAGCVSAEPTIDQVQAAQSTPVSSVTETPLSLAPTETQPASMNQAVATEPAEADHCQECHVDKQMLIDTSDTHSDSQLGSLWGLGAPMEPWKKVLVNQEQFPGSIHGLNGCIDCHGGLNDPDKETAHQGVDRNPSRDAQALCGQCHPNIVATYPNSLHNNLAGFREALEARGSTNTHPVLEEMFETQCQQCHATCGECHVSQPNTVGGGFIDGHLFVRRPSMIQNCNGCHGSRVGKEYLGENEGLEADVHLRQGQMDCTDCHDGARMHGVSDDCSACHPGPEGSEVPPPDHRYAGVQAPRCESCHAVVATGQDDILMHQLHSNSMSCQVCHSISYTSCNGCHITGAQDGTGTEFALESMELTFLIGRNPSPSYDRPYEYVPVRHIPIDRDSFSVYGQDLMPNFDNRSTWQYTTPHNIQRNTPQTSACTNCHGNPDLFLTADKLAPEELDANQEVIIEEVPREFTSAE